MKKFIVKTEKNDKNFEKWKIYNLEEIKLILKQMKLDVILEELDSPRIHDRIFFCSDGKHSYLSVSIKPL